MLLDAKGDPCARLTGSSFQDDPEPTIFVAVSARKNHVLPSAERPLCAAMIECSLVATVYTVCLLSAPSLAGFALHSRRAKNEAEAWGSFHDMLVDG